MFVMLLKDKSSLANSESPEKCHDIQEKDE
jgi:hypothetical protein